jgi:phosphoribosylamine---glycine ligase
MKRILLIGKSGRLDCMAAALHESSRAKEIIILSEVVNRSLCAKGRVIKGNSDNPAEVAKVALETEPDLAVIGPEEPLAEGVVNTLEKLGVKCFGPTMELAQIETSKAFARKLVDTHLSDLNLNPRYKIFRGKTDGLRSFLEELGDFVVKPDGLTGGKGVRVSGEHLFSVDDGLAYCNELITNGTTVVVEEKLDGEEFSYQSLTDGKTTVGTIPIQDHKRANEGDKGPNTGGMGSYSCSDHSLPFLDRTAIEGAKLANERVVQALREHSGELYRGVLYGGFIQTRNGLKLIEYNARFGDPEVMNVLPIMDNDFLDVCDAIVEGSLGSLRIQFAPKATVCKYVVPEEYPNTSGDSIVYVPEQRLGSDKLRTYFGAVTTDKQGRDHLARSRAIAFVGIADTLDEAEQIAEQAASSVKGKVRHRRDIGTAALVQKRVRHMDSIKSKKIASAA